MSSLGLTARNAPLFPTANNAAKAITMPVLFAMMATLSAELSASSVPQIAPLALAAPFALLASQVTSFPMMFLKELAKPALHLA